MPSLVACQDSLVEIIVENVDVRIEKLERIGSVRVIRAGRSYAEKVLGVVSAAAKLAGVGCETLPVAHTKPIGIMSIGAIFFPHGYSRASFHRKQYRINPFAADASFLPRGTSGSHTGHDEDGCLKAAGALVQSDPSGKTPLIARSLMVR
jgi:hypothetical protein